MTLADPPSPLLWNFPYNFFKNFFEPFPNNKALKFVLLNSFEFYIFTLIF